MPSLVSHIRPLRWYLWWFGRLLMFRRGCRKTFLFRWTLYWRWTAYYLRGNLPIQRKTNRLVALIFFQPNPYFTRSMHYKFIPRKKNIAQVLVFCKETDPFKNRICVSITLFFSLIILILFTCQQQKYGFEELQRQSLQFFLWGQV